MNYVTMELDQEESKLLLTVLKEKQKSAHFSKWIEVEQTLLEKITDELESKIDELEEDEY